MTNHAFFGFRLLTSLLRTQRLIIIINKRRLDWIVLFCCVYYLLIKCFIYFSKHHKITSNFVPMDTWHPSLSLNASRDFIIITIVYSRSHFSDCMRTRSLRSISAVENRWIFAFVYITSSNIDFSRERNVASVAPHSIDKTHDPRERGGGDIFVNVY